MAKVILIGFMGSGKSTVARRLGELLAHPVVEMDEVIVERSGLPSVAEIFAQRGEAAFRDLESAVAESLAAASDVIVSTGGGVVTRDRNMEHLRANGGTVFLLHAPFDTVAARNAGLETRPLFRDGSRARQLFEARAPLYARWADETLDSASRSVDDLCSGILSRLNFRP